MFSRPPRCARVEVPILTTIRMMVSFLQLLGNPMPPLGAQGEVARSAGGDQNRRSPPADNPSVSLRLPAPLHRGAFLVPALFHGAFLECTTQERRLSMAGESDTIKLY